MDSKKYLRQLFLVGIYIVGVFGIVASTGGGGDDDDDDEIVISSFYNFQLGGLLGNATDSFIDIVGDSYNLSTKPDLQGEVICDQNTETCGLQTVDAGSSIDITGQITTDPGPPPITFDVDIDIIIETDFFWDYDSGAEFPFQGRLLVTPAVGDPIRVEVTNCTGGDVLVTVNPPNTGTCYSWIDFEDLVDDATSSAEELQASLAWEALAFIVEQGLNSLEVFPLIVDNVFAALGNPLVENCEMYMGAMGSFTFFWDDVSNNNQPGPGDSFVQTFTDCWFGEFTEGVLLDGGIDYVGYIQVIDFKNLLTDIGFESVTLGDGIDPLDLTETDNNVAEPTISLTGSFRIVFER